MALVRSSGAPVAPVAPTITGALELPRIVRLGPNLFGAAFSLMKLLPARHILDRARDGELVASTAQEGLVRERDARRDA